MKSRRLLKVGLPLTLILLIAVGMIFALSRRQPQLKPPQISARFVGLTNDATGTKFARFEVRNDEHRKIEVWLPGSVDIGRSGGGFLIYSNVTLHPGAVRETWIEAPTNRLQWRAEFLCSEPLSWMAKTRNLAHRHGAPVIPVVQVSHHAYSDWVFDPSTWIQSPTFGTNGATQSVW